MNSSTSSASTFSAKSAPRKQTPPLVRWVRLSLLLGLLGLGLFIVTGAFDAVFVLWLAGRFENGFRQLWWLNPHVGKLVGAVLLMVGGPLYFRWDAWCPQALGKRVGGLLMWAGIVATITHVFALFGTQDANFDERGRVLRFYAIDPDNKVRWSYYDRVNPLTGVRFSPVTPEVALELRRRDQLEFAGVENPLSGPWFSPGDGRPLLWYARREDGTHHFYNLPGFDPVTSVPLAAVTPALRQQLEQGEREAHEKARQKAKEEAEAEAAAAQQAAKKAEEEKQAAAQRRIQDEAEQAAANAQKATERVQRELEATQERLRLLEQEEAEPAVKVRAVPAEASLTFRATKTRQDAFPLHWGQWLTLTNSDAPCRISADGPVEAVHLEDGRVFRLEPGKTWDFPHGTARQWSFRPLDTSARHLLLEEESP